MLEEKQKLEDVRQRKTSLSIRSTLRLPLRFTLREKPSVLSDMVDKTFAGRIKKGAKYCYASYPGKFKYGFEALTSDFGEFSDQSVACVYFCTKEDGLGCHHPDPEDSKGRCYCRRIYGEGNDWNRDYETRLGLAGVINCCSQSVIPPPRLKKFRAQGLGWIPTIAYGSFRAQVVLLWALGSRLALRFSRSHFSGTTTQSECGSLLAVAPNQQTSATYIMRSNMYNV